MTTIQDYGNQLVMQRSVLNLFDMTTIQDSSESLDHMR